MSADDPAVDLLASDIPFDRWTPGAARYTEDDPAADDAGFSTPLPDALVRLATMPAPRYLVRGLIPGDGITLLHSQPREWKTLTALQIGLSIAAGVPLFGLERLAVEEPAAVLYITNEDSERRVLERLRGLVAGLGLAAVPAGLHVAAGCGVDLDDPAWRLRTIREAQRLNARLVILDPLRSVTACVDQGPAELKPFAGFCRRLIRETPTALLTVHHDSKPPVTNTDTRRRPQRASGGGLFSIADYPIAIDPVDDGHKMLAAHGFKFSADPDPIVLSLVTEGEAWRLVSDGSLPAGAAVLHAAILAWLEHTPGSTGSAIARGVQRQKQAVLDALHELASSGRVDALQEKRRTTWFLNRTPVPNGSHERGTGA